MRFILVPSVLLAGFAALAQDRKPTAEEQKTIDAVFAAGGKAAVDPRLPAEARVAAEFESISDIALLALKTHARIGAIDAFDATKATAKGFAALKELPNLRRLVFGKSSLTLATATAIGECAELRYLGLADSGLTDAELAGLKKLARLEHLTLSNNPKITDKGMQTVKGFERLRELYLANTALTDKGLAELKGLDGLRTLNLANTKVSAEAAEKFVDDMPNLRTIRR